MKNELQNELYTKFPKIFRQKDCSIQESCMPWGMECGDGWHGLILDLCVRIQAHLDLHPEVQQVEAEQVKEKFGGLRFYVSGGDEVTDKMITKAEEDSYTICESCGSTVGVHQTESWIKTLCSKCDTKIS